MPEAPMFASRAARVTLVMSCLFGTTGVILVFLPRWLEVERGLAGAQIGAVIALAQIARIATGPAVAFWADGAPDRRTPLRIMSVAALAAYAAFFFLPHDFWSLLAIGFIALSLTSTVTPFVEGATLRATATGRMPYGVARGIGSIAFILANIGGGIFVARFGVVAVVVWVLTGLACFSATTWFALKPDPAPPEAHAARGAARFNALKTLLRNRRFVILILACGLIQSAHAFYYSFSTLTWRAQGVSAEAVGFLWGIGVLVEVAFLWTLPFFERRIRPEHLILIGAAGGALRWLLLGFAPTGFLLWPLQMTHALSFAAAHVGAMRLLYREAPESAAGMAQTLYGALSSGLLMGGSTLLSGVLYDAVGAQGYWAMAVIALAGGLLALLLLGPPPKAAAEQI